jgi:hypothetical protein
MITPLEEELTAAMRAAVAGFQVDRDLVAGAREDHRQRITRRRVLASAAAAALVAAGGLGFGLAKPNEQRPVSLSNAAWVTQQVGTAIDATSQKVQHTKIRMWGFDGNQLSEGWYDPITGDRVERDANGPGVDVAMNLHKKPTRVLTVNRYKHTWWAGSGVQEVWSKPSTPSQIRAELKSGHLLRIVGKERIAGAERLHLRMPLKPLMADLMQNVTYDLWVDQKTFQLVRTLFAGEMVQAGGGLAATHVQTDYQWLDRTPATLAHVKLTVPRGYSYHGPSTTYPESPKPSAGPTR